MRETAARRGAGTGGGELPCVWVLSGILNYHLCDRDYDCEGCDLFQALRGRTPTASRSGPGADRSRRGDDRTTVDWLDEVVGSYLSHLLMDCRLYLDRWYRPPHMWLFDHEATVSVGLDPQMVRLLEPITEVVTPGAGVFLDRDQPCGWISRRHRTHALSMPIAGEILERNPRTETPGRACRETDWLFRVQPAEPVEDVPGLLRDEEALLWHAERIRILKKHLRAALLPADTGRIGPIMSDGGTLDPALEDVLGSDRFNQLIDEITAA